MLETQRQTQPASRRKAADLLFTLVAYGLALAAIIAPFVLIVGTLGRL